MEIVPVSDGRGLERFIAFPYDHYRADPLWVAPLRRDVRTLLSPAKNPFFQHAHAQYFLAVGRADGQTVGRIAAIQNDAHTREHRDRVGFYGFFESIDDADVAHALFDAAAAWLRARGFDTMRGPVSPSINDECGLLIAGNGTPPALMMGHNPPYYVGLHERYGFVTAKDLLAYEGGGDAPPARYARLAQRVAERAGISLRPLDMKRFSAEIELVKALYNRAWEKNWGFVPLTEAEIDHLAAQLKPIVIPDLVVFAERAGDIVGFGVGLPDLNVALRHNPSGRLFPGILKILWHMRKIHRARILLLGVVPELRGRGIDGVLYQRVWENCVKHGMPWGEAGWILEDNVAMNKAATQLSFRRTKTYRIYDKTL